VKKAIVAVLLAAGFRALPAVGSEGDWQEEVSHLLDYIVQSSCTFIRNDKVYDGAQAGDHINRKYEQVKNRISSTEQFISYAASRSSMTGKPYQVTCGETTMPSSVWLDEELRNYRGSR
jgi:hypothetical protein